MISLYISLCLVSEIGNTQISQMSRSRLLFLIGGVVSKPCLLPKTIDVSEGDIREILGCHRRTHIVALKEPFPGAKPKNLYQFPKHAGG